MAIVKLHSIRGLGGGFLIGLAALAMLFATFEAPSARAQMLALLIAGVALAGGVVLSRWKNDASGEHVAAHPRDRDVGHMDASQSAAKLAAESGPPRHAVQCRWRGARAESAGGRAGCRVRGLLRRARSRGKDAPWTNEWSKATSTTRTGEERRL